MPAPQRPFWKRKRWIAAAVLWLVLPTAYPLSAGPVLYATLKGWMPYGFYNSYVAPAQRLAHAVGASEYFDEYLGWWWDSSGVGL